jgi:K+-transporting ATPase ATPase B chain
VRYQAIETARLLSRDLMIYGLGGVIAPFIGIKAIDVLIHAINLASIDRTLR